MFCVLRSCQFYIFSKNMLCTDGGWPISTHLGKQNRVYQRTLLTINWNINELQVIPSYVVVQHSIEVFIYTYLYIHKYLTTRFY